MYIYISTHLRASPDPIDREPREASASYLLRRWARARIYSIARYLFGNFKEWAKAALWLSYIYVYPPAVIYVQICFEGRGPCSVFVLHEMHCWRCLRADFEASDCLIAFLGDWKGALGDISLRDGDYVFRKISLDYFVFKGMPKLFYHQMLAASLEIFYCLIVVLGIEEHRDSIDGAGDNGSCFYKCFRVCKGFSNSLHSMRKKLL